MKTDTLFYYLFQKFPSIFFELIGQSASLADDYQFTSIELKQVAFRLDGLFLPPIDKPDLPIYFVEVQFQSDETFYYRLFAEIFLYLYQYNVVNNWQAIVVYPRRSIESTQLVPYQFLLNSDRVRRVYLDELGANQSLGVGIVQLVIESNKKAPAKAINLISQARQQVTDEQLQQQILEFIETIVIYKFPNLNRQEVEAMLGLDLIKNTRVYQEAQEEGKLAGKLEGKLETVPRLLKMGLTLDQVAEALDLDIEVVRVAAPKQP